MLLRFSLLAAAAVLLPAAAFAQSLTAAARTALGPGGTATLRLDGEQVRFRASRLVETRFGPVLLAEGRVGNFSHISPGRVGAWYLRRVPGGFVRARAYPEAVTGGSMGGLSEWGVSTRFAANPVISAEGGFTGQGITCSSVTLTELTPAGPVLRATVPSGYENNRMRINGKIAAIVPGRSFQMRYSGTRNFTETWVRRGQQYRRVGPTRFPEC